jgi:hypothetical protein
VTPSNLVTAGVPLPTAVIIQLLIASGALNSLIPPPPPEFVPEPVPEVPAPRPTLAPIVIGALVILGLYLEIAKASGTLPEWAEWMNGDALPRRNAQRRARNCCEAVAMVAAQVVKSVGKSSSLRSLPERDSAGRFRRNKSSRRN